MKTQTGNGSPRVTVVLDTPNLTTGVPLAGTPARLVYLASALREAGAYVNFVLGDRGMTAAAAAGWQFPGIVVNPQLLYGPPDALLPHLRELRPDILVLTDATTTAVNGRAWADELHAVLVYEAHDDEASLSAALGESEETSRLRGQWQRIAACNADYVTVLTERERTLMLEFGLPSRKILLAPNGANLSNRTSWGPSPETRRVLFIGNLFYEPNAAAVKAIREMVRTLRARHVDIEARIVGRGPDWLVQPEPGMEFLGAVPDLDPSLQHVALGLAPLSMGSGMKCKVIDYMSAGLPVLATREAVNGLPPGNPGIIVSDDLSKWPALLAELLAAPELLRLLGTRGLAALDEGFCWPAIGKRVRATYSQWRSEPLPKRDLQPTPEGSGEPNWLYEHARKQALGDPLLTREQPVYALQANNQRTSDGKDN